MWTIVGSGLRFADDAENQPPFPHPYIVQKDWGADNAVNTNDEILDYLDLGVTEYKHEGRQQRQPLHPEGDRCIAAVVLYVKNFKSCPRHLGFLIENFSSLMQLSWR